MITAVALAACGGGDDDVTADTTVAPGASTVPPATVDPAECFEVPEAATVVAPTTVPATSVPDTTSPDSTPDASTTVPETVAPTTVADTTPDSTPGTVTPGIDESEFPAGETPTAVRPCELPAALQVTTLRPGTGRKAELGDTIYIDYIGVRSEDGAQFDESYSRGTPIDFPLGMGQVIAGWDQGLIGAQEGSLVRLDIPAELAYADTPRGDVIQAGDALTFVTEVRLVIAPATQADAPQIAVPKSVGATEVSAVDAITGDGAELQEGQTAIVHTMFVRGDNLVVLGSSWESGTPQQIPLLRGSTAMSGLIDGLIGTNVGSTRVITIPPALAYGETGAPSAGLPAGVDLIVIAQVLGVIGEPADDTAG